MFVRAKRRGDKALYYLVRNERHGGRVRQKTLAYLGESPTLAEAVAGLRASIARGEAEAERLRAEAERWRQKIPWTAAVLSPIKDGVPRYVTRSSNRLQDPARRYWQAREEAESSERWARRLRSQLDNLLRFEAAA